MYSAYTWLPRTVWEHDRSKKISLATAISVRAWQAKDDKDWLHRSLESITGQRWQRLATAVSVRTWQAKDDKDWLRRSLWEHDRPKMTKTGYGGLCENVTGQSWPKLATTVPSRREIYTLTRRDGSNHRSFFIFFFNVSPCCMLPHLLDNPTHALFTL